MRQSSQFVQINNIKNSEMRDVGFSGVASYGALGHDFQQFHF